MNNAIEEFVADDFIYTAIGRLHRTLSKGLRTRLEPLDISPGHLHILHCLWQRDGLTQTRLRQLIEVEQATLSNTLKRMERNGLLSLKRKPSDRRILHIQLTDKGKAAQQPVKTIIADVQKTLRKGLTTNDRRYFRRILKQVTEQAESEFHEPVLILFDEVSD